MFGSSLDLWAVHPLGPAHSGDLHLRLDQSLVIHLHNPLSVIVTVTLPLLLLLLLPILPNMSGDLNDSWQGSLLETVICCYKQILMHTIVM